MTASFDKVLERRIYAAGRKVFVQGDIGDAAYIVENGAIGIYRETEEGKQVHLGTLTKGSLFGEMAVIDDGKRMASAVALEGSTLLRIPADQMKTKLAKADPFLKAVLKIMLDNLRNVHQIYVKRPRSFQDHVAQLGETTRSLERYAAYMGLAEASPEAGRYLALLEQAVAGLSGLANSEVKERRQPLMEDDNGMVS